jgi:hypothetical protein
MVHIFLPGPPSACKEVHWAFVGGIGRGPHTAGALREPSGSDKLSGFTGLLREEASLVVSDSFPHTGSGSFLGRKALVQFPAAFLTSPHFCAVHFSFDHSQ